MPYRGPRSRYDGTLGHVTDICQVTETFMKTFVLAAAMSALFLVPTALSAADKDATPAPATKPYSLDYCIVSGDKLDDKPIVVVKDGQEFKLCCKDCIKDLDKDPKKFEDKLAAAQKKPAAGKDTAPAKAKDDGHMDHDHADHDKK